MTQAILFDFDGTIADSRELAFVIYNEVALRRSFRTVHRDEIAELRLLTVKELLKRLEIPKRALPSLLREGLVEMRARIDQVEVVEGLAPVLRVMRNEVKLFGIVTSNSVENVELFLARHQLDDLFDFVVSSSKLSGKARHFRRAMEDHQLDPDQVVYVGDEIRDVKAARKAGIRVVAVSWGFNAGEALADAGPQRLVDVVTDLPAGCGIGSSVDG